MGQKSMPVKDPVEQVVKAIRRATRRQFSAEEKIRVVLSGLRGEDSIAELRHSLDFVSWKDRKPVAAALKGIYRAVDAEAAEAALGAFEESFWGQKYPAIGQSWRRAWTEVIPFYAFPGDVRRILYTTNAIEALNAKLRRAVRARGHFPSDEAATKLLFLVLNRSEKQWIMPPREWAMAKSQFAILFGERFTAAMGCSGRGVCVALDRWPQHRRMNDF